MHLVLLHSEPRAQLVDDNLVSVAADEEVLVEEEAALGVLENLRRGLEDGHALTLTVLEVPDSHGFVFRGAQKPRIVFEVRDRGDFSPVPNEV